MNWFTMNCKCGPLFSTFIRLIAFALIEKSSARLIRIVIIDPKV